MDDLPYSCCHQDPCQRRNQNQESSGDESDQEDLDDTTFAESFDFDPETFGFKVISWCRVSAWTDMYSGRQYPPRILAT